MNLNWKDPKKELPREGEIVWVLYKHWKNNNPMSYELMSGEVEYNNKNQDPRVCSCDYTGKGNWSVYLLNTYDHSGEEYAEAWIYPKDFQLPDWILNE